MYLRPLCLLLATLPACVLSTPTLQTCLSGQILISTGSGWECGKLPSGSGSKGATGATGAEGPAGPTGPSGVVSVAPGPTGSLLASNGTDWVSASPGSLGLVQVENRTIAEFVSPSGSDTACDGTAAAAASAAPHCAFATLQHSFDMLPPLINGSATVQVAPGTYYGTAGVPLLQVNNFGTGSITVLGSGGVVTFSGGSSAAPTTQLSPGFVIPPSGLTVTLQDIVIQQTKGSAITVTGASLILNEVSALSASENSLVCQSGAICMVMGTSSFSNSGGGILIQTGGSLTQTGSLTASGNMANGIDLLGGGELEANGSLTLANDAVGVFVNAGSTAVLSGTTMVTGSSQNGIHVTSSSTLLIPGSLTIATPNMVHGLVVEFNSSAQFSGSGTATLTGTSTSANGIWVRSGATVNYGSSGALTISGFNVGINLDSAAHFLDETSGGTCATSGNTTKAYVTGGSVYTSGNCAAATTCNGFCY